MHKFAVIILACMSMIVSFAHAEESVLIVGTNAEFPPFTYIEKGEIVGFDVDVAKEIAKRLHKEIKFKDMPFDALIPEVTLGHVDFVAAGISFTEERAKRVLFTKSYLTADPLVIFTTVQKKMTFSDLIGKNVVVVEGFTADLFMSQQKGVALIRLPTQADAFLAVKSGRADAFVTALSTVNSFLEAQDSSQYQYTPIENTADTCAIMVPKSKPQMLTALQQQLDAMEKDGTLTKLKVQWKMP